MIQVQHVSHAFELSVKEGVRRVPALWDVSFEARDSEFLCILGPSGCGKTTLLRIVAGLIKPENGQVREDGKPLGPPGVDRCMVFQQFGLLPWRTVRSNVEFGLELQGVSRSERKERAQRFIDLTGLTGFEHHFPHQLSGGMQQRVGIARALSMEPSTLLMDEPFSAVDAHTRELLQEELLRIWERDAKTVLFVTHSIDEAIYLADRVLVMDARPGRIKEDLPVDLPRPRLDYDVRAHPTFTALRSHIAASLKAREAA